MKNKTISLFVFILLCTTSAFAKEECFILFDLQSRKVLMQEGNICSDRLSPCSTFKIALSLLGYDAQILKDTKSPEWLYQPDYEAVFSSWKLPHNPTNWIKDSCVWYSQVLTQKLGLKKFKRYIKVLHYGNQDLSGDPGKNNGLTKSWLSSSLKISAQEQILFLERILNKKFPFSEHAYDMTKQIFFVEKLNNGWELYGKTGTGYQLNSDGSLSDRNIAWFVGWATKKDRTIIFIKNRIDKNIKGADLKEAMKQFIKENKVFNTGYFK